jgi:hypothetical protein
MTKSKNVLYASLGEAALILLMGAIALAVRRPLIFASLGPTAYELVEKPLAPSARTYNIIVGHMVRARCRILFSLVARCLERAESCIRGLCNFCAPLAPPSSLSELQLPPLYLSRRANPHLFQLLSSCL